MAACGLFSLKQHSSSLVLLFSNTGFKPVAETTLTVFTVHDNKGNWVSHTATSDSQTETWILVV